MEATSPNTDQTRLDAHIKMSNGSSIPRLTAAVAGLIATGVALGVGELVGSVFAPTPGPVTGVTNQVIEKAPTWFVNFGKSFFGTADKPALIIGTIILSAIFGVLVGMVGRRSLSLAALGLSGLGLVGFLAVLVNPLGSLFSALIPITFGVVAGIVALAMMLRAARSSHSDSSSVGRRQFVGLAAGSAVTAVFGGYASVFFRNRRGAQIARDAVEINPTDVALDVDETVSAAAETPVARTPGISPVVVPNDDFYRIDTATLIPQVDPKKWSMTIKGMVENEITLTYDDLLERSNWVAPVTLSCVSNEIGGGLVGNAIWQGFPLTDLLDEAGVLPGATQIASRSVDGWDCGFPTELAYDGRTAMVAIAMNGEPLPLEHGFPARLVISGLYGYVSATKWLSEIELTTIEDFNGFWIPRGWSKTGPVKTQSRIDTPKNGRSFSPGETVPIGGVAWAPNIGIERVEISVDDGEWTEARLGESVSDDSWIQWSAPWVAASGEHVIQVRATDKSGYTQTDLRTDVAPDGASGWHSILVNGS